MKSKLFLFFLISMAGLAMSYSFRYSQTTDAANAPRVLVFTKTKGFVHSSIPTGVKAIQQLGAENNFIVDTTSNADYFTEDSLKNYSAVIFLSTTMNVLNAEQQVAFERYIQAGGGYAGVHAAADTEYDWPWYNRLVGAYFKSHPGSPNVRKAMVVVVDSTQEATKGLPAQWERTDEWYNYKNIQADIHVLAKLDEDSYEGGENGENHPIAWYHEVDGGRSFYTGGGHTEESFSEPLFLKHLLGGIHYAMGSGKPLDYTKAYSVKKPEDNRFVKTVLSNDLNEPMELAPAPDGRIFFVERTGNFYVYLPKTKTTKLVYRFPVKAVDKYLNGLLGMTIDPDFSTNHYLYFFHTVGTPAQYAQHISRFVISNNNQLDLKSEKVLIEVPIDPEVSAHTGGSLAWDKDKNLFISTGDNTVPFESEGYAPIDRRPNRLTFDAERSAGNPGDLRGKILRIHPEPDGSYTIPPGNLFPANTPGTKPEIFVMGCRNPYRISVDQETSILYWGEVGPDAGTDGPQGPRGYDEFNQAKKAGNFGWPYFVGNTKPYHQYDFATKEVGPLFNEQGPDNISPYNTGAKKLPPANPAMIWYPYNGSAEFPSLGQGGRCAIGGPVFHFNSTLSSASKIPAYYDKAWFICDWMRNWVYAVRLDSQQNYLRMEPFMESNGDFRRPIDLEVGADGSFYMLEYGSVYGIDNVDARLVRIDYNGGNRTPLARIDTKDTIGTAPFAVKFSQRSEDPDDDKLQYDWSFGDKTQSQDPESSHTYVRNGVYRAILRVTDPSGKSSSDTQTIRVGNTLPEVRIETTGSSNASFFFDAPESLNYKVTVTDKEDKTIDPKKIITHLQFLTSSGGMTNQPGHQEVPQTYTYGKSLVAKSDCKACHQLNAASVGPSFTRVSQRYAGDKTAVDRLANKIIKGGGGVWGEHAMSAHPQLSKDDASEIVRYILSLTAKKTEASLPPQGQVALKPEPTHGKGRYVLSASYRDNGGAITPLTSSASLLLRPAKVQGEDADGYLAVDKESKAIGGIGNKSYMMLKQIDLSGISQLRYRYSSVKQAAKIVVHIDSPQGAVISSAEYQPTGDWDKYQEITADIKDPGGRHDLYFVFTKKRNRITTLSIWIGLSSSKNNSGQQRNEKLTLH